MTPQRRPHYPHFFSGNFAPLRSEHDWPCLELEGRLPPELQGSLYRVGPNPQFDPRDDHYHWFTGDGMVHAFRFGAGRVAYRNRWVRTPKWQLEHAAGRALFGSFGNPATSDPAAAGANGGTANTNLVWHGGRLFVLEESHQPFEIDPHTLAPIGHESFGGRVVSRFTAHPKRDPATGELHFFAYSPDGPGTPGMQYGVLDAHCNVTRLLAFEAPYASMAHDFMLTRRRALFPVMPLTVSGQRARAGGPALAWEDGLRMHVGVLARGAAADSMRWFEGEACHVFHVMNAWDEGDDTVVALVMQADAAPGLPDAGGRALDPRRTAARLHRWTFDLGAPGNGFRRECLDDLAAEFPHIDARRTGLPNRFGYYACHATAALRDDAHGVLYDSLACMDVTTGERRLHTLPAGDVFSEPVFVPRHAGADEGDGWLLAVAWRSREQRSDLLVLDAAALDAAPVALARLPHRVPFGFHGHWRPDT